MSEHIKKGDFPRQLSTYFRTTKGLRTNNMPCKRKTRVLEEFENYVLHKHIS